VTPRRVMPVLVLLVAAFGPVGCQTAESERNPGYQTVEDAPRRDTERAEQLNAKAVKRIAKQQYKQAADLLKKALTADVTYGPAHNNLGKVYYHQKRLYRAAWEFQYAIKLMPDKAEPKNNLGLALEAAGKLKQAVDHYESARELAPDNPQILGNLTRTRLKRGHTDKQLEQQLQELILKAEQPRWAKWAREQLMLLKRADPSVENPATTQPQH